ncbi:hypothetical protein G8T71_10525 [Clostridium botulinum C/D]|uniref:hypothetical protein n=1 Tax=Clostridium botulinum TaxID=1491 RepID=UPI001E3B48AB|nr:hypothetical protein [Clostridium botulinum]MCD3211789.1 hypothetical protein [Clostridium botulinum C/D]
MKVRELIANLQKQNMENDIFIQDRDFLLDVFEVTDGKAQDGETFTVLIPED